MRDMKMNLKRGWALALVMAGVAGCATETRVVRSSLDDQLMSLNGKGGASVERGGQSKTAKGQTDPNVRVLREANFNGLNVSTSFTIDDPRYKNQQKTDATQQPPTPMMTP